MCRAAAADGITHMVATPHANDRYHYDREYLRACSLICSNWLAIRRKLESGLRLSSFLRQSSGRRGPSRLAMSSTSTRYLLVEFSNYSVPAAIRRIRSSISGTKE